MLSEKQLKSALLGSGAAVALLASPAVAGEVSDLKAQIEALQGRLDQVEAQQTTIEAKQERVAPANVVTGGDFPGSWKLPGSDVSLSFSGYVKMDAIYDLDDEVGDSFAAGSIALPGSADANADGQFRMHARQSRIRFDTRAPTDWGSLRTRIEGDFFGAGGNQRFSNSNGFRLRQAFAQIGPLLAGQTFSTFNDQDTFANTLDFGGPVGVSSIRQAQLRYSASLAEGLGLDLAIENPELDSVQNGGNNFGVQDQVPDMVAALRYRSSWGAVNASVVGRNFNFDNGQPGESDNAWGYGLHFGGNVKVLDTTTLKAATTFGHGVGRYIVGGGASVAVGCKTARAGTGLSPNNSACEAEISPQWAMGWWAGVQHKWTDQIASNVTYGQANIRPDTDLIGAAAVAGLNHQVRTVHANVIWSPISRVNMGLEYIHGWRNVINNPAGLNSSATASRFQFSTQVTF